jgi:hypothetical protein
MLIEKRKLKKEMIKGAVLFGLRCLSQGLGYTREPDQLLPSAPAHRRARGVDKNPKMIRLIRPFFSRCSILKKPDFFDSFLRKELFCNPIVSSEEHPIG